MEEELKLSEEKYRNIVDNSLVGVFKTNLHGQFLYANKAFVRIFEVDSVEELIVEGLSSSYRDSKKRELFLENLKEKEKIENYEIKFITKKGNNKTALISATLLGSEISGMIMDITELKQAEAALLRERDFNKNIIQTSPAFFVAIGVDGKVILMNEAMLGALGYTLDEVVGKDYMNSFVPEEDRKIGSYIIKPQQKFRGPIINENHVFTKDGRKLLVEWHGKLIYDNDDNLSYFFAVGINITDRKRMDEELKQNYDIQRIINSLLHLSQENISLEEFLERTLDLILSIPRLSLEQKGSIFLVEDTPDLLIMKAKREFSEYQQEQCLGIPFGKCLCGIAAQTGKVLFANNYDERHEIHYEGIKPHSHFCVPVLSSDKVLGVINMYVKNGYQYNKRDEDFLVAVSNTLAGVIERKYVEELYRTILSTSMEGFWIADSQGNFLDANDAACRILGYSRDELMKMKISDIEAMETADETLNHLERIKEAGWDHFETRHKHREGNVFDAEVSVNYIKERGGRVFVFTHDITERKKAEEILKRDKEAFEKLVSERTQELMRVQMELEKSKRLSDIGTLAATVAHELRNPLSAIRMAAYNIKRKAENPSFDKHFSNIEKKIVESDQIINNLLFYSRIKIPIYEQINLYDILEECIDTAKERFLKNNTKIEKNFDFLKNFSFEADPLQLKELFSNILNNSYDAVSETEGMIKIEAEYLRNGFISIIIRDNGPGIDSENLKKVFEPFFTTKSKGTGLGLSVCNQIADLHGGNIRIDSEKRKGTKVIVVFPVRRSNKT